MVKLMASVLLSRSDPETPVWYIFPVSSVSSCMAIAVR
jgi:hypothetical protein